MGKTDDGVVGGWCVVLVVVVGLLDVHCLGFWVCVGGRRLLRAVIELDILVGGFGFWFSVFANGGGGLLFGIGLGKKTKREKAAKGRK